MFYSCCHLSITYLSCHLSPSISLSDIYHYLFTRFASQTIVGTPNTYTPCVSVTMPLLVHSSGIHHHINQEKQNPM